jgi:hypothetical protein
VLKGPEGKQSQLQDPASSSLETFAGTEAHTIEQASSQLIFGSSTDGRAGGLNLRLPYECKAGEPDLCRSPFRCGLPRDHSREFRRV